jgi:hypothetical protein
MTRTTPSLTREQVRQGGTRLMLTLRKGERFVEGADLLKLFTQRLYPRDTRGRFISWKQVRRSTGRAAITLDPHSPVTYTDQHGHPFKEQVTIVLPAGIESLTSFTQHKE